MVDFENVLGIRRELQMKELEARPIAVPTAIVSSSDDGVVKSDRVDAKELENCYVFDPIVFNSINKTVQTIMGAGYDLRCDGERAEDILTYFKEFLDSLGKVGEDTTFNELLWVIYQNQFIYGRHFLENVYNPTMKKILDLVSLDPKQIDYARDLKGRVVLDIYGKPVGYVQTVPQGVDTTGRGDQYPATVSLKSNQIFLLPNRIVHFKLYTYGDRFEALGVIEPAYKSIVRRQNIEEAQANSIYARGTYPIIASVGDREHYPTSNMIQNALDKISLMQHNRYFAFPYWYKIEPLEVKQSEVVDNTMKYLRENSSASLGLPIAFAIGSGEATNRATLEDQQKFLEFSLNDIARRTCATIRKQIFKKICELKKFPSVPYIVWGDIGTENLTNKSKRLNEYVKNGVLTPDEVKQYALNSEELTSIPPEKNRFLNKEQAEKVKELGNKENCNPEDI